MARKDASLELRKARPASAQLELNQTQVVRYQGRLAASPLPPTLDIDAGLTLPATLASQPPAPLHWARWGWCSRRPWPARRSLRATWSVPW